MSRADLLLLLRVCVDDLARREADEFDKMRACICDDDDKIATFKLLFDQKMEKCQPENHMGTPLLYGCSISELQRQRVEIKVASVVKKEPKQSIPELTDDEIIDRATEIQRKRLFQE